MLSLLCVLLLVLYVPKVMLCVTLRKYFRTSSTLEAIGVYIIGFNSLIMWKMLTPNLRPDWFMPVSVLPIPVLLAAVFIRDVNSVIFISLTALSILVLYFIDSLLVWIVCEIYCFYGRVNMDNIDKWKICAVIFPPLAMYGMIKKVTVYMENRKSKNESKVNTAVEAVSCR